MQARLRCGRDKTWLHNSQSNASSNIIDTMFELAVVSGDASTRLAYRLFEDGMSWKLLSEWQYLEELVCSRHGVLTELYVPMTDHMKTALRSAEDFVGTQVVLPFTCEQRRLEILSSALFLTVPIVAPRLPHYGCGLYRFEIGMDEVETGVRPGNLSTIRFVPWLAKLQFRPVWDKQLLTLVVENAIMAFWRGHHCFTYSNLGRGNDEIC